MIKAAVQLKNKIYLYNDNASIMNTRVLYGTLIAYDEYEVSVLRNNVIFKYNQWGRIIGQNAA